jgi:restriction system protein
MAKRGFFAELHHQNQVAARKREQAQRAAARQHAAAVRAHEAAQRQAERARVQAERASAAEKKAAEATAKRMHLAAMQAEVESRNLALAEYYDQIDGLLAATLEVDDWVDLESLRSVVEHPPFPRPDLRQPLLPPPPLMAPPEPQWAEPETPKGLGGMIGGKKRHEAARQQAWTEYLAAREVWQAHVGQLPTMQLQQMQAHQNAEQERQHHLSVAQQTYDVECAERQAKADEDNRELDELIAGIAAGVASPVQEYVSIVLGNSVYPDGFDVSHSFEFDSQLRELALSVTVPGPDAITPTKAFKYVKATDEITSTDLPQKARKDRYSNILCSVALRTAHEIFEADRLGVIGSVSMTVGVLSPDPATGQMRATPLIALATDRERFEPLELANVIPQATLEHLGALVSKNPSALLAVDTSFGVRSS